MSPRSHGVHCGRKPRIRPSITAVQTNTTPRAAAVCRPTAATPAPITAEIDAATPTRSEVDSTSAHHAPSVPSVDPRRIAAPASPADRNATIARVITRTPAAITRTRDANQRRRRGSQVRIVLIVPVCHETATTEAPTTSPMMLVIEEMPSRMPGRSASCRWDPMYRAGSPKLSSQNRSSDPPMGMPSQSCSRHAANSSRACARAVANASAVGGVDWKAAITTPTPVPMRDAPSTTTTSRLDRNRRSSEPISRITRPPRGRPR